MPNDNQSIPVATSTDDSANSGAIDTSKMSKQEMIDKIIGLVESIKVTRKKTEEIKKQVLEKMHELERLQKKREVKEIEQEMDEMLAQ